MDVFASLKPISEHDPTSGYDCCTDPNNNQSNRKVNNLVASNSILVDHSLFQPTSVTSNIVRRYGWQVCKLDIKGMGQGVDK